jgi:putative endopeptidase
MSIPCPRPIVLALCLALVAGNADAQKRKRGAAKAPTGPTACTDYYAYANAAWLKAHPQAPGGMASALGELGERALQQQRALLDGAMAAPQGDVQKLLGDFWASGLDEAAVERDGAQPIAPLLKRIDAIRRARDIPPAIAALHQVGIPVAFNFAADVDLQDLDRHIGYFSQGGLGLPDPAFYTRTDADTRALLARYTQYVQAILALAGTPQKRVAADAALVLDLETRIARASRPLAALDEPFANYAPVPTEGLGKDYKRLQLAEFLKAQGVRDDTVSIADKALFAQLDTMAGGLKPAQWQAYLRFHVGNAMAPYLSRAWREAEFDFRGRLLRGESAAAPRWRHVLDAINTAAGPMLGREYAARHLTPAARAQAEAIAGQVRDALARAVDRSAWYDPPAKMEAKAKLARLRIEVGTPRRDLDYTVQPMGRGSFGGNMLIASTWRHREEMKRIGRGNADRRWPVLPQQPALAYDPAQNRLIVSAAMLQPPVFDPLRDAATQYGAFGALVGHELSHAVDGRGRSIDASGRVRDWWSPAVATAWDAIAQRVSAQYAALPYPGVPGTRVDAARTRDANLGDIAGVELAWDAFLQAQPQAGKESRQAFFQGWAGLWPQQVTPDGAQLQAATGVHAPGQWRTNAPLLNLPAFGETFACKAGTPMQLKAEQQVRIWR